MSETRNNKNIYNLIKFIFIEINSKYIIVHLFIYCILFVFNCIDLFIIHICLLLLGLRYTEIETEHKILISGLLKRN
jgi:hypothetical protein